MKYFIDVIVPLALQNTFTYRVTDQEFEMLQIGCRVVVPFGKSKYYTAVVQNKHHQAPLLYEAKYVHEIIDIKPKFTEQQLKLWQFVAEYYMCSLGEIYANEVPTDLILKSETILYFQNKQHDISSLSDSEYLIYEALQIQPILTIEEVQKIIGKKNIFPIVSQLVYKEIITLDRQVKETYKPKTVKYVQLSAQYQHPEALQALLEKLHRSEKQRTLVLTYFKLKNQQKKAIKVKELLAETSISQAIFKSLVNKNIFEIYDENVNRVIFSNQEEENITLSQSQNQALTQIYNHFSKKEVALLHGVTGSGKTEIYFKMIEDMLSKEKQILYLVPEIALTTQLVKRLTKQFGDQVMVYHSKYSPRERYEVWNRMIENPIQSKIIIGVRSSVFLPFTQLGLVIVDEEHENTYKQHDPAPRYHARDTAIVLAKMFQAKVLLGSATPSIESYYNAYQEKYGLVELTERFNKIPLPEITLIDLKDAYKRKEITGHFSVKLIDAINEAIYEGKQVILFQNRRGFSPILECLTCGYTPKCTCCAVSLTYYKKQNNLKCHYCGYTIAVPTNCHICKSTNISTKGFGTEQIEEEIKKLYPNLIIARMDQDTTKKKYAYEQLIDQFKNREIDILVGTQMLAKGLDFENVGLVGVLNADTILGFPDFRAHERAYQMLVQVAGRAGRKQKGKVYIQTYNPLHNVIQQVTTSNYQQMFKEQSYERYNFQYPPFFRIIRLQLKHADYEKTKKGAIWIAEQLKSKLSIPILGPEEPSINRIRNQYIQNILIKIPANTSLKNIKETILKTLKSFESIAVYRSVRTIINVDFY